MDSKEEIFVSEEEKARMASWNSMPYGKLELVTVPNKISTEQAHEVAMAAAQAAARVQSYSSKTIGAEVAQAYLQAYEAVEGWRKPQAPITETVSAIPHVSLHYGQSVDLFNVPEARYMRVTCTKNGWDWDSNVVGGTQPKDA